MTIIFIGAVKLSLPSSTGERHNGKIKVDGSVETEQ
jgi:hypothetical protein